MQAHSNDGFEICLLVVVLPFAQKAMSDKHSHVSRADEDNNTHDRSLENCTKFKNVFLHSLCFPPDHLKRPSLTANIDQTTHCQ